MLELLEKHPFQDPSFDASLRNRVATELLATDPVEAESIVDAIASPRGRALGYVWLAEALPAAERDRKRGLLERATVQVHAPAVRRGPTLEARLFELARVAGGWLDLGEVEKARPLIREGLELVAALPPPQRYEPDFLATAARIEPDRVLSLIRDLSDAADAGPVTPRSRNRWRTSIRPKRSVSSSSSMIRVRVPSGENRAQIALRLCRSHGEDRSGTGATDHRRAENAPRAGLRLGTAGARSGRPGQAGRALGPGRVDPADRSSARSPEHARRPATRQIMVANNPAASILPIVEKVAPERLEEVFWKAVALMPKDDMARERGIADFRVAEAAIFLARYDRQVADVFVTQAMSSHVSQPWFLPPDGHPGQGGC